NVFEPTVVADITPAMSIFRTECFGPVASVIKAAFGSATPHPHAAYAIRHGSISWYSRCQKGYGFCPV
ncbi:MAG: aldehyde dehydrogenase family protein, partial [Candidatus Thiodiazotropha sp.]